jgi:hypothetical protein
MQFLFPILGDAAGKPTSEACPMLLDFPASRTVRNAFIFFMNYLVYYIPENGLRQE